MNNQQISYFKRALVMLMAVMMVFTYMPSMAWADGDGKAVLSETLETAKQEVEAAAATWGLTELTDDLTLPETTSNGCEVVWSSSKTTNLTNTGEVKRPNVGASNATGTLSATIYDKADSTQISFSFVVKSVQANEMEQAAKEELQSYLDLQEGDKIYGDIVLFDGKSLGCNPTSTDYKKGIVMQVPFGGNNRNVYVTVEADDKDSVAEAAYSGSSWGKNSKIELPVTRGSVEKEVKLTFTMKVTASDAWTAEKTVVIAAKASEEGLATAKSNAEKAFAAIEDYDGSNAETLQTEAAAAKAAVDTAYKAGWDLATIATWKNYAKIAAAEQILENRDYTVTLTIQGYNKGDLYPDGDGSEVAYFVKAQPLTVKAGWSVYDVLNAAAEHYGMKLGGSSTYVSSIGGLSEKMLGAMSGWMYRVNNDSYINVGMGSYKIKDGDSILIYYVKDWGSVPACSFAEIGEWAQGKENVNLLGSNDMETLEKDWAAAKASLDANTEWYSDLPMPVRGENNSRIVWKSSDSAIVAENGKVTRAAEAVTVKLTATLYQGSEKLTKTYDVKIGGTGGITVTVKIEGKDEASSLESWTGCVKGGSVTQYDPTVTWNGYGEYILPAHALMTRLKASDENFKFNDNSGLKSYWQTYANATIDALLGVKSENNRYWRIQVVSKDGTVKYESKSATSSGLYFAEASRLADGDTVIFRYTANLKDLQTAVNTAKAVAEGNYTAESYATLKSALEKGEALIANGFAAEQSAVDAAKNEIESAIAGLESKVDLLEELPNLLKNLSESENWQSGNGDGYGVLALSRAGLSMTEKGIANFVNGADSDLKRTYTSRPDGSMMRSAVGMTALGKDLNYYVPSGGTKTALAQMWQDSLKTTNTSSLNVACWLLISRTGAYPELHDGDKTAVEKRLLDLFSTAAGGWGSSATATSISVEYTTYAILALADVYADDTNENHEDAVEKIDKAIEKLKASYTKSTGFTNRCYTAIALMAVGVDPETVKVEETGLISSFIPNLLADRTGFSENAYGTSYTANTPTAILTLQMYKEFKASGKAASLNVKDAYPTEAKKTLNDTLTEATALEADDYTADSYAPFAEAIKDAQKALCSLNTTAEQAEEYEEALKTAEEKLALTKDTTKLKETIAEAQTVDLAKYDYTDTSKKALTDALSAAQEVLNNETARQALINEKQEALRKAIDGLQINGEEEIAGIIEAISKKWIASESSTDDDWKIVDMAMLGKADALFANETDKQHYVSKAINGINPLSVTDYERVLIALTALGIDGSKLNEYRTFYDQKGNVVTNLIASIQSFPESALSVNGATFALLAFDSGEYEVKSGAWSRENLVQYLLKQQLTDGGWNLQTSGAADPDVTAMAVSALAPYAGQDEKVANALTKALGALSSMQDKNGKYTSYGTVNSNSSAMAVIALASAGKDAANDENFVKWSKGVKNSVLSGLLTFKTNSNEFGYQNKNTANALSTEQGLRALSAYKSYLYAKTAVQPYAFGKPGATEKWEEEAVATALEIVREPSKTTYQKGEKFESSGLSVKVTFSDGTVIEPATKDLEIIGFDSSTAGSRTLRVQYQNAYAVFQVNIEGSSTPSSKVVYLRVADPQGKTYFAKQELTYEQGETAFSVLGKAGLSYRPNWNTKYEGVYVEAIEGLAEFDGGSQSGWMYRVNGYFPSYSASLYNLKAGDYVEWLYTRDLGKDIGGYFNSGTKTEETKTVTTDTPSGSTTTTAPTETKVTEKVSADGTKEKAATVTVSTANQTEIIKQATDKKSAEIVLEVASTATSGAQNVQLQLNVSFVKNVSEKTDAALTVNTENGTVSLDQNTIKTVLDEAKGATITLDVNKVVNPTEVQKKAAGESGQILSLTVKSGDKTISDFKTGKVTVTVAISTALQNKRVAAIHIAEDGKIEQMPGRSREVNGKKCFEFTTSHFSDFALVDADELGLETEDEIDAAALVAKLTPVARSAKTAKGYIKVTTNLDKSDKAIISQLKDAGYTVKYRFYRSTRKSAGYKSAITKKTTTYTNTSGKKDTKYYYKVQVRVYDESGKLVARTALKQCKYAARTK